MIVIKIIKNIIFTVTIVVLILGIALFTVPLFTDIEYRAVQTGSMEPDIPTGSLVVVVPTASEDISIGDDVTYVTSSGQVVTHRVIEIDRETNTFVTYGIANGINNKDPELAYENIIGVAKFHIPWLGLAVIYLDTLSGKIVAGTVILSLFILSTLLSVIVSGRKEKDEGTLSMETGYAGKGYSDLLDVKITGDDMIPLYTEGQDERRRAPSVIEREEKPVRPVREKSPELLFEREYEDFYRKTQRKKKKGRRETTEDFWNGGDGL